MVKNRYTKYMKLEPYDYQKEGIEFGLKHNYCILGDEMGLARPLKL